MTSQKDKQKEMSAQKPGLSRTKKQRVYQIPPKSLTATVVAVGIVVVLLTGMQGAKFHTSVGLGLGAEWFAALAWVENNTNPGEVVASWWDYGYWVETYAHRTTIANGATVQDIPIRTMAKALLANEEQFYEFCEDYNISLFILDVAQDVVGGKWGAMAHIASVNTATYVQSGPNQTMQITPAGQAAPIFRMASVVLMEQALPFQKMDPVYISSSGSIVIYSYRPHWSQG